MLHPPKALCRRGILVRFGRIENRNKFFITLTRRLKVIEPLLCGIVLGLCAITLAGLFYKAYVQFKRGNELGI